MLSSKESVGSGLGILHETWKTKAVGDEGLAIFCLSGSFSAGCLAAPPAIPPGVAAAGPTRNQARSFHASVRVIRLVQNLLDT